MIGRPDVLFLSWRDVSHPEGGGSERYVHRIAERLADAGLTVEIFCAAHARAGAEEVRAGVRIVRRGGRLGVYARALVEVLRRRPRVVVDVHNGVPFLSTLVRTDPVVVLVHHVHREQWPLVFGRVLGALGWWLESRVAVRAYRRCRYVTVSRATARELAALGVGADRITIVHNGVDPAPALTSPDEAGPRLIVVARLVPHKQVEHAIETLARLRARRPDLTLDLVLDIVGEGRCAGRLRALAARRGVAGAVRFHGFVDEPTKHALLARASVHLCPSLKEGWGAVVLEAAGHEVPTVAYRWAGGLREAVRDRETGRLVDDHDGFVAAVEDLLDDRAGRRAMGAAAARYAQSFDWGTSGQAFGRVIAAVSGSRTPAPTTAATPATGPVPARSSR